MLKTLQQHFEPLLLSENTSEFKKYITLDITVPNRTITEIHFIAYHM